MSANRFLFRQAATAVRSDSEGAGTPAAYVLWPPLDYVWQAAGGTFAAYLKVATSQIILGSILQQATVGDHNISDVHPAGTAYAEAQGTTLSIHALDESEPKVTVAAASTYTAPGDIKAARFSRAGDYIAICYAHSSTTNRNGGWAVLPYDPVSRQLGSPITPSAETGSSSSYTKYGVDWLPSDLGLAVWGLTNTGSTYRLRVYPFAPTTGVISAYVASEQNVGTPDVSTPGRLVACRRIYNASTSYVFVAASTTPYAYACAVTLSSGTPTALGAPASPTALAGSAGHVTVAPDDSVVLFGHATTPYMTAIPFTTVWGTKKADPATALTSQVFNAQWTSNGTVLVVISGSGTTALKSYVWSASGFGAQEPSFDTLASGSTRRALAIPQGERSIIISNSNDVLALIDLNPAADRKGRPIDTIFAEATTLEAAATVRVQIYQDLAETVSLYDQTVAAFARTGRYNLLSDPQDMDGTGWTQTSATVTADQKVTPNGEVEGDLVKATGANGGNDHASVAVSASTAYEVSAHAQPGASNWAILHVDCGGGATATYWFNAATGAAGTVSDPGGLTGVAALPSVQDPERPEWWRGRLQFTTQGGATTCTVKIRPAAADNTASANNDSIHVWGADLRLAANSGAYEEVPVPDRVLNAHRRNWLHVMNAPVTGRVVKLTLTNAAIEPRVAYLMLGRAWTPKHGLEIGLDTIGSDASSVIQVRGGARALVPGTKARRLKGRIPVLTVVERALVQELASEGIGRELVICRDADSPRHRFTEAFHCYPTQRPGIVFDTIYGSVTFDLEEAT